MFARELTRRGFFKVAGKTGLGVYLVWGGANSGSWLKPNIALAADLKALSDKEARDMLAMARDLFPHDKLGDEFYWVVVESIDKEMAGSSELAARIREGFAEMSQAFGKEFSQLSVDNQIAAMKKVEGTPFFSDMLNKTSFYFYNNKNVWPKFGYEGSSWEKGGYINRGFNDIKLPGA